MFVCVVSKWLPGILGRRSRKLKTLVGIPIYPNFDLVLHLCPVHVLFRLPFLLGHCHDRLDHPLSRRDRDLPGLHDLHADRRPVDAVVAVAVLLQGR